MAAAALNSDLIADLAHRRVALFIGAGVSASAKTTAGKRIKTWSEFLAYCNKFIPNKNSKGLIDALLKKGDYLTACEALHMNLETEAWTNLLQGEFNQRASPSSLHHAIASLDQRILITTNIDKLLEMAIEGLESTTTHYRATLNGVSTEAFKMFRDDKRYIIKLHGTVDAPESLVFTKKEYIQHAIGNRAYADFISTLLSTHTLMFIGFSMDDPAVSSLVELHASRHPSARPHYILQPGPVSEELVTINKTLRKLYVIPYDPKDNHSRLVSLVREMGRQARSLRKEMAKIASAAE